MKKLVKKRCSIIALILVLVLFFSVIGINLSSVEAASYILTFEVNNKEVALLYNAALSGHIKELEEEKKGDNIVKYTLTVDATGKPGKSVRTKPTDDSWEFVGWSSSEKILLNYAEADSNAIQPEIHGNTSFIAYYKPAEPKYTITYKVSGGTISGGYVPSIPKKSGGYDAFPEKYSEGHPDPEDYILESGTAYINGVTATPKDDGYEFLGWKDSNTGEYVSKDLNFKPDVSSITKNVTYTAEFKNVYTTIHYKVDGNGTLDGKTSVDERNYPESIKGFTAVADEGNNFVAWTDNSGNIVSLDKTFAPTGDLLKDGATYIAVFSNDTDMKIVFLSNVDPENGKIGYISGGEINTDYTNKIFKANDVNHTVKGIAYNGYVLDHISVDGENIGDAGIHVKHEYVTNKTRTYQKPSIIKAYFKPADSDSKGEIHYKVKKQDNASDVGAMVSNEIDYSAKDYEIQGSTAVAGDGAEFIQWEREDGTFYSSDATIKPSDKDKGETFIAVFKGADQGRLLYNINLKMDIADVKWTDKDGKEIPEEELYKNYFEKDNSEYTTSHGCPRFSDKNKYYNENDEAFTIFDITPEVDGYIFVGWFDKNRRDNVDTDDHDAAIRYPGQNTGLKYVNYSSNLYSIDAIWIKLGNTDDVIINYDGQDNHSVNKITYEIDTSVFTEIQEEDKQEYLENLEELMEDPIIQYKDADGTEYSDELSTYRNVGTYPYDFKVTVNFHKTDYSFSKEFELAKLIINPIPLKITADSKTAKYNEEIPELTAQVEGLLDCDKEGVLKYGLTTPAKKGSKPGTYPIDVIDYEEIDGNKNYIIEVVPASLTITNEGYVEPTEPEEKEDDDFNPFTGDHIIMYVIILSGAVGVYVYSKKYNNKGKKSLKK